MNIKTFFSVPVAAVSAVISAVLLAWPDSAFMLWQSLPVDVRALIPEKYTPLIGGLIYIITMLAKAYKNRKGAQTNEQDNFNS